MRFYGVVNTLTINLCDPFFKKTCISGGINSTYLKRRLKFIIKKYKYQTYIKIRLKSLARYVFKGKGQILLTRMLTFNPQICYF
jgi:hypothetical protein